TVELTAYIENVPEMGYKTVWVQEGTEHEAVAIRERVFDGHWETPFYIVEFNQSGWIDRLYDKQADKEIIRQGEHGNELQLFDDLPTDWDAWDIDPNFKKQYVHKPELIHRKVVHHGRLSSTFKFVWKINQSYVTQDIVFYQHHRRIDFKTTVDWQETHKLLNVYFRI